MTTETRGALWAERKKYFFKPVAGYGGDGYRVDSRILVERVEGALRVPTSALFREHDEWCAFVVEDGRAKERTVRLRAHGALDSAVESGIGDGAVVLEQPSELLRDGARVETRAPR